MKEPQPPEETVTWKSNIVEVRAAHLRASQAELAKEWHMAAHHYLYCLEEAHGASDRRAVRFFASRLAQAYRAMGFIAKANYYRSMTS